MLEQGDIVQGVAQQDRGEFIELHSEAELQDFFDDIQCCGHRTVAGDSNI